jgi:hypothetical protein
VVFGEHETPAGCVLHPACATVAKTAATAMPARLQTQGDTFRFVMESPPCTRRADA